MRAFAACLFFCGHVLHGSLWGLGVMPLAPSAIAVVLLLKEFGLLSEVAQLGHVRVLLGGNLSKNLPLSRFLLPLR